MKPPYPPYKNKWSVSVKYTKTISPPSSSAVVEALSCMILSKYARPYMVQIPAMPHKFVFTAACKAVNLCHLKGASS